MGTGEESTKIISAPFSAKLLPFTLLLKESGMSLKSRQQPTEPDHIRDTLTDVVGIVGEARQDVKQLVGKVDANHKEICARLDQLELLIRQLFPNAKN